MLALGIYEVLNIDPWNLRSIEYWPLEFEKYWMLALEIYEVLNIDPWNLWSIEYWPLEDRDDLLHGASVRILPVNKDALCYCTLNVDDLEKMLKWLASCSSFEKLHLKENLLQFIRKTVCFSWVVASQESHKTCIVMRFWIRRILVSIFVPMKIWNRSWKRVPLFMARNQQNILDQKICNIIQQEI